MVHSALQRIRTQSISCSLQQNDRLIKGGPCSLTNVFISYSILMKPQNYLLFGKLSSKIKLVLRLNDQFFKFYAFYKQNLWAA